MKRVTSFILAIILCLTTSATAFAIGEDETISPYGNLASIYKSETPYYGTSSSYSELDSVDEYNVELRERLASLTTGVFISLVTAVCPPLGKAVGGTWSAAEALELLFEFLKEDEPEIHAIYVRAKCYTLPVQPTPLEVVYSKYVIEYYTDSEYENYVRSDVYYQKLVYNLH